MNVEQTWSQAVMTMRDARPIIPALFVAVRSRFGIRSPCNALHIVLSRDRVEQGPELRD